MRTAGYNKATFILLFAAGFIVLPGGCKTAYHIDSIEGKYIQITTTGKPDTMAILLVDSYRKLVEASMNEVIGYAVTDLTAQKPESSLTNFTADVMLTLDTLYTGGQPADFSLINVRGHRAPIRKGDITVGDIYSTYAFENELIVLTLTGKQVLEVFASYARMGGAGISSTVKLKIRDKELVSACIHDKPIDPERIYTIVTIDYLAEGNDGMQALVHALSVVATNVSLRNHVLNYIRNATARGKPVSATTDQRITLE